MSTENTIEQINKQRSAEGFLTISETLDLIDKGNIVLDPFSALISKSAELGRNNYIYQNVTIQSQNKGIIKIGDGNIFHPNTFVLSNSGKVMIGNENQFGDSGCTIKASSKVSEIVIGDHGRYINGAQIIGKTHLGSGSQVIGPITVQDCTLESGEDFKSTDPDSRAGVLKGSGLARGIRILQGEVINGNGNFLRDQIERQSKYHSK